MQCPVGGSALGVFLIKLVKQLFLSSGFHTCYVILHVEVGCIFKTQASSARQAVQVDIRIYEYNAVLCVLYLNSCS